MKYLKTYNENKSFNDKVNMIKKIVDTVGKTDDRGKILNLNYKSKGSKTYLLKIQDTCWISIEMIGTRFLRNLDSRVIESIYKELKEKYPEFFMGDKLGIL